MMKTLDKLDDITQAIDHADVAQLNWSKKGKNIALVNQIFRHRISEKILSGGLILKSDFQLMFLTNFRSYRWKLGQIWPLTSAINRLNKNSFLKLSTKRCEGKPTLETLKNAEKFQEFPK